MPDNREIEKDLFTNPEVLAINQKGLNPRELVRTDDYIIWASDMPETNTINIGIFNISDRKQQIDISFESLNLEGKYRARDLWKRKEIGNVSKKITVELKPHEPALLRLQK